MFSFSKKLLSGDTGTKLELPTPDFIPYACHFDAHTLLTRNGELMQVIKITGFSHETVDGKKVNLRDTVRKAVLENVKGDDFALWFHTVRRKRSLDPEGHYDSPFCRELHAAWTRKNYWNDKYVNELYITILHEGLAIDVRDPKGFIQTLSPKEVERRHNEYLDMSFVRLQEVVDGMLQTLAQYGAKKLGLIEEKIGIQSEILQFLAKIMHLAESTMPLPINNLAEYLTTHKVAFGNNTLEVRGPTGKHFAAILSIKEYHELTAIAIDKFLQLPQQFIVTQTLDFINSKKAMDSFQYQNYILTVSQDERFRQLSGLDDIINSDTGSSTDFGEQQLLIMLIEDDLKKLDIEVRRSIAELSELGIVTVREDVQIEQCFWSQLPGNFTYICRKRPINTARIAGFASLHNFPAGKQYNNLWGAAVTIFRTALGTPYFFNFHYYDNGHTVIIGPRGAGKTALLNFFVSESRKFNSKLFFFDQHRASKVFIRAIGGEYSIAEPTADAPATYFNPLQLPDTVPNRLFLQQWFAYLLMAGNTLALTAEDIMLIEEVVRKAYLLPEENRQLSAIAHLFGGDDAAADIATLRGRLAPWVRGGKYAGFFDNIYENFDWSVPIWGVDVSELLSSPSELLGPVLSYYFHRINQALDGSPVMVVVDEAWSLLDNRFIAPILSEWFHYLRENNALIILASESIEHASKSQITGTIMAEIATQIYLPNPQAGESYKTVFGLSHKEFALLTSMKLMNRHFLLKQGEDAIVGELNLAGFRGLLAVLSGGDKTVHMMEEIIEQTGPQLAKWLPVFTAKIEAEAM